jgi:hypothetical protein
MLSFLRGEREMRISIAFMLLLISSNALAVRYTVKKSSDLPYNGLILVLNENNETLGVVKYSTRKSDEPNSKHFKHLVNVTITIASNSTDKQTIANLLVLTLINNAEKYPKAIEYRAYVIQELTSSFKENGFDTISSEKEGEVLYYLMTKQLLPETSPVYESQT